MTNDKWLIGILIGVFVGIPLGYIIFEHFKSKEVIYSPPFSYTNIEIVKWVDWKGRERTIEIHREAH